MTELNKLLCTDSKVESLKKINAIVDAMGDGDLANKDLSNLTAEGEKHFLNKSQITNCILEVPQKIKLELADGVLTLKSGSKAPVPNGVGVFEEVVTTKDIIIPTASGTQYDGKDFMLCIRNNGVNIDRIPYTESGTDPSNPTGEWCFYYDTAVNKIYLYNQGLLTDRYYSFPIAKLRAKLLEDGVTFTWEILQVFNGMGYIGSSLWVDKGVKGLIPSGRNEDGTLNNIEFVTSKVLTRTFPNTDNMDAIIGLNATTIGRLNITGYSFDYENNYNDNLQHPDPWMHVIVATCTETKGVISNFQPKQPVHLVDMYDVLLKSDKSEISGWGMPSTKYTNLTIGATGTYYTAPANGWFYIGGSAGANWQFVNLYNSTKKMGYTCYGANGSKPGGFVPVTKGDSVVAWYTVKTVDEFRFIYAEGEV